MRVDGLDVPMYTLELPWKNNKPNISCIPTGKYTLEPILSPSKGQCFNISCPARKYILMHSGNVLGDSRGCLLVGLSTGYLKEEYAVLTSRKAMQMLLTYIQEPTELVIKNLHL
jgi:hypothetical protein